ncbi:MAG TPA: hypothetical protein DDZ51_07875 [Planctomycetaceae bacterium]|nr:hypothetical protein [Planctomycetaceae bacterium]
MKPTQSTDRFEIWKTTVRHYGDRECLPRKVFFVFPADPESSGLISFVVVDDNHSSFVEWIYVEEDMRRSGVATEVLRFIEQHGYELTISGATPEGNVFTEAYTTQFPRHGLVNNAFSLMIKKSERFDFWMTRIERTPANDLLILQAWPQEENQVRPVGVMTVDRAKSDSVNLVCADGIDREKITSEMLYCLKTFLESAEVENVPQTPSSGTGD